MNKCDVRGTRLRRTDEQRRTASTTCLPIDAEDPAASGWSSEFVCVCFSPWNAASNCRGESIYSVLDFLTSSAFIGSNQPTRRHYFRFPRDSPRSSRHMPSDDGQILPDVRESPDDRGRFSQDCTEPGEGGGVLPRRIAGFSCRRQEICFAGLASRGVRKSDAYAGAAGGVCGGGA